MPEGSNASREVLFSTGCGKGLPFPIEAGANGEDGLLQMKTA
jgi:hypothetical protein